MGSRPARSSIIGRAGRVCATCARGVREGSGRYSEFLLEPGTLFTLAAGVLLVAAIIATPSGVFSSTGAHAPLYIAAAVVGSSFIWWSAVQGIRERDFTADIPGSIATAAALAAGQFSAAAIVAVLLLAGGLLEEFVATRANHALDALEALLPDTVTVRRPDGDVIVALAEVRAGDVVLVRPGERIAIDGVVLAGDAQVNQAAITGESVPVDKSANDEVFAGTSNAIGALEIRAAKVGEETTLGQIRRMVSEAQEQKAPIERILDRYAKLYTPGRPDPGHRPVGRLRRPDAGDHRADRLLPVRDGPGHADRAGRLDWQRGAAWQPDQAGGHHRGVGEG